MLTLKHAPSCELVLIGSMASTIPAPNPRQMDPDNDDGGMDAAKKPEADGAAEEELA